LEALAEDFFSDEAAGAGEDDFHDGGVGRELGDFGVEGVGRIVRFELCRI